jgi:DNA mismatch repair protein MutS2
MKLLREKEERLIKAGGKEFDREVQALQGEIDEVEGQIRSGLAQLILGAAEVIDAGVDVLALLDIIFAKAAFGLRFNGAFPQISNNGEIAVEEFIHPVLAMHDGFSLSAGPGRAGHVTPVDLFLSKERGKRALLISGPNGGGKTLSMKSFGLVGVLTKIGIPIPIAENAPRPRIDFIDEVLVNVGDKQNVIQGESTWTSLLNSCSRMIETVQSNKDRSYLVLLDELGSGTDPNAGGAVAQAILEEFMTVSGCQIVATTHSPQLKTLSYDSDDYSCATVLLEMDSTEEYKKPTFRLEYGIIGESYALGAASRCNPPLAESLLARASQLLAEESQEGSSKTRGDYIQALTNSMEDQVERTKRELMKAEKHARDSQLCRKAMLSLAASYETQLDRLERRLDDCYRQLREDDSKDDLEVIGDTLAELKIAKKQILSQQELLRRKGLKLLPTSYALSAGESVIVVASESEWDGRTVQVIADGTLDSSLGPTEVLVRASTSFEAWDSMFADDNLVGDGIDRMEDRPWIVQRHELAIWDYDSIWEEDGYGGSMMKATSVPDSKRRLNSLLSTLKSDTSLSNPTKGTNIKNSFASARARKAATKKKK